MGRYWRALKLGMKSLLLHKLRSGLTVLGIVFGVAAVISMLAVGEGSSRDERYQNYAVLAAETTRTAFPYEDPIGKSVKLGSDYYTVVGVTKERASTAGIGGSLAAQEFNKDVYIPMNTCRLRFGDRIMNSRAGSQEFEETQLSQITLQVGSLREVSPTHPIVEGAIKGFHPKKDVDIIVPLDLLNEAKRTARQFSIILGTIASISLLVGGIGIMNIMLATVTERTREIGIRRALGAKRKDITMQFLIETVVLSGVGGVLGVCIGIGIPQIIGYFIPD